MTRASFFLFLTKKTAQGLNIDSLFQSLDGIAFVQPNEPNLAEDRLRLESPIGWCLDHCCSTHAYLPVVGFLLRVCDSRCSHLVLARETVEKAKTSWVLAERCVGGVRGRFGSAIHDNRRFWTSNLGCRFRLLSSFLLVPKGSESDFHQCQSANRSCVNDLPHANPNFIVDRNTGHS